MCTVFLPAATRLSCLLSSSSLQLTESLGKGSSLALGSNALVNDKLMSFFFFFFFFLHYVIFREEGSGFTEL